MSSTSATSPRANFSAKPGAGKSVGRRVAIAGLVCLTFHLHLLCDVAGSKGPDGSQWPIPYLEPFSDAIQWAWSGQWELNAWPNVTLTLLLLGGSGVLAVRRGWLAMS